MWQISTNKSWKDLEKTFPWVELMKDVPQDPTHHAEGNVAVHTQMVLAALQSLPTFGLLDEQQQEILWAAALLHDVEKSSTTVINTDGTITSAGHARKGELTARQILYRDVVTPFEIREQIAKLVRYHGLPLWVFDKPDPRRSVIIASLEVNMQLLALLARADALGRICKDQQELLYRIDCFEELCKENECFYKPRRFTSSNARMYYLQKDNRDPDYVPFETAQCEVLMTSGLPGAGKDTYIQKHYKHLPVISLDDIRREKKISPDDKHGNGQVIQLAKEKARVYLRNKTSFVWNATNITKQMREQLISLFTSYNAYVTIVYVEAPAKNLLLQNKGREHVVPNVVMERLINKWEVPVITEAHEIKYVV